MMRKCQQRRCENEALPTSDLCERCRNRTHAEAMVDWEQDRAEDAAAEAAEKVAPLRPVSDKRMAEIRDAAVAAPWRNLPLGQMGTSVCTPAELLWLIDNSQ